MFHRDGTSRVVFGAAAAWMLLAVVPSATGAPRAFPVGAVGATHGAASTVARAPARPSAPTGPQQGFPLPGNLADVALNYPLSDDARRTLQAHGFVALSDVQVPLLSNAYFALFLQDRVSVVITTDVALHLFHNVYDGLLAEVERQHLAGDLEDLVGALYADAEAIAAAVPEEHVLADAAARHNLIVFAVAARLLDPAFAIPSTLEPDAGAYVLKVLDHSVTEFYPGDDYTIYEPRGHYAGDPELERYFRAVKWLGRRIYRIEDRHYPHDADVELVAAVMLGQMVTRDARAQSAWARIYDVTSLLVGTADSVTPVQMMQAVRAVFGDGFETGLLESAANRAALRAELAKDAYPTSEIIPVPLASPDQIPPKYVQVMGERYLPDAAVMHATTFPNVSTRLLPSGLDVMATLLGSDRAGHWLADDIARHPRLDAQIAAERAVYDGHPDEWWTRSVYTRWLQALRPVLQSVPPTAPLFTQSAVWQDKQLNTAMGSWTQLRHDVIVYGKQTVVPSPYAPGPGLVEPVPETFYRLGTLCETLHAELTARAMLPQGYAGPLVDLGRHLAGWALCARKVRDGEALTAEEQTGIHTTGLWLLGLFAEPGGVVEKSPLLVADVATDSNTTRVLHEGTGHFRPLIVVYTPPGGEPIAGIGFAFSQYEFVETDWNRLTDQEWEGLLATDPPDDPPWVAGFLPGAAGSDDWTLYVPRAGSAR